jgi:hypothetical protein
MNTGDVHPLKLPPGSNFKNQSPDGRMLVGMIRERTGASFYACEVEKDDAKTFPLGRGKAINEVLWLGNDRCAVLMNNSIHLYDRKRNSFEQLTSLPAACNKMLGPSPEGKRFFCGSRKSAFLVDVEARTIEVFKYPAESMGWITDDVLVFANDLPDTSLRGTFYMRIGNEPQRILEEPFLSGRDGSTCVEFIKEAEAIVFGTKTSLFRLQSDGSQLKELLPWTPPGPSLIRIEKWPPG